MAIAGNLGALDTPRAGATAGAPAPSRTIPDAAVLGMSATVFVAYVMLQLIEYGALHMFLPILKIARVSTILSYALLMLVVSRYKGDVFSSRQAKLFATFVVFTGAGIMWAVVRSYVPLAFRYHIDYFGLFIITAYIVDSTKRTTVISMAFVSVSVLLVRLNFGKLGQETRIGAFDAPYFMGDGNDFGWGLIVMLPFALYLMLGKRSIFTRGLGIAGFVIGVIGIIGTESRGATLALGAAMILFWLTVSKRKALFGGMLVLLVLGIALLAPPAYFDRMNKIQNYEDDSSAQGRLRAWKAARQMALDYPLGVGANNFNSAYGRYYMPADPTGYAAFRWMSTHSCYFKVLAEYGYPGLIIFLVILGSTFNDNRLTTKRLRELGDAAPLPPEWPALLNVSLIGYSVCGIFLGGITYPHLYLICGMTVAASRVSKRPIAGVLPPAEPKPVGPLDAARRREPARAPRPAGLPQPSSSPAAPGRFF